MSLEEQNILTVVGCSVVAGPGKAVDGERVGYLGIILALRKAIRLCLLCITGRVSLRTKDTSTCRVSGLKHMTITTYIE